MTFEQLQERHEALAQTVELMGHRLAQLERATQNLIHAINQDGENIRTLAHIAEIHERRLTRLEGGTE